MSVHTAAHGNATGCATGSAMVAAACDALARALAALRWLHVSSRVHGTVCREQQGADPFRWGTLVGSAMGGMSAFAGGCTSILTSYKKMNPFCIPFAITNMGSAMLAMDTGLMGPTYSISTACATGNYCMLNAYNHIVAGEADVMLAGATDAAVIPSGVGGFIACKALSSRNNAPAAASRPWDRNRDGFVLGEGSGVLVLESLEHARARGARIYAELLGGAANCDAHHMTEPRPDGTGVAACVRRALDRYAVQRARTDVHTCVLVHLACLALQRKPSPCLKQSGAPNSRALKDAAHGGAGAQGWRVS